MNKSCVAITLSLALGAPCGAVTASPYQGFSDLEKRSDSIVVATILDEVNQPPTGDGAIQNIRLEAVWKGSEKPGAQLRTFIQPMRFEDGKVHGTLIPKWIRKNERYVLFLQKERSKDAGFRYRTLSTSGDVIWVPPLMNILDLKTGNVRENIRAVLAEALSHQREELTGLQTASKAFLGKP
jgi:hypothetical protein